LEIPRWHSGPVILAPCLSANCRASPIPAALIAFHGSRWPVTLAFPCGLVAGALAVSHAAKLCRHRPGFLHSTSSAADDN
jgi:hypothetical protein